jgi:hypothetical protein
LMIKKAQSSNKFVRSQNAPSKGQYESVTNERHCRASGLVLPPFAPKCVQCSNWASCFAHHSRERPEAAIRCTSLQ